MASGWFRQGGLWPSRLPVAWLMLWMGVAGTLRAQTVEYLHTDALGSPVAVTDAAGKVVERTVYEPYGAQVNRAVSDGPGFTGHVSDAATGLSYMQQRYYDPQIGRMLSVDPVVVDAANGNGFGRYTYASNNPYRFIDPDGRCDVQTGTHICSRDIGSYIRTSLQGSAQANSGAIDVGKKVDPYPNVKLRPGVELRDDGIKQDLQTLSNSVDGKDIDVISGYRSQEKQDNERKAGNARAAKTSQHTVGVAADIKIKGISKENVGKAAYELGRFERVNIYSAPNAGVHVDYFDVGEGTQMYQDWKRVDGP